MATAAGSFFTGTRDFPATGEELIKFKNQDNTLSQSTFGPTPSFVRRDRENRGTKTHLRENTTTPLRPWGGRQSENGYNALSLSSSSGRISRGGMVKKCSASQESVYKGPGPILGPVFRPITTSHGTDFDRGSTATKGPREIHQRESSEKDVINSVRSGRTKGSIETENSRKLQESVRMMRTGSKDKEKLKRMLGYKDPLLFNYFEEKLNPGVSDGQAIGDRFGIPTNVAGGGFPDSLSIEDGEENLLEPTANIYPHLRVANSLNWRQIRDLNPLCKYAFFSDDVWTIDTTVMSPEVIPNLPIRIGERPVILNYLPSTIGSFPYHPDPAANRPIDPRKDVDDETLRFLFRVYPGARAACVYLNKTLVILHDGELNRRAEFRKRPRKFGGLHVDHALFNRRYTAGSVVERGRRIEIGSDGFGFKYSLDGEVFGFTDLRVGLRLRHKIKTDCEVLTMPVHSLLSTIEYLYEAPTGTQKKIENTPWYNPAEFLNTNGKNFKFDYFGKEFGKLHSHFESISNSNPRGDLRMLQYDIALIEELDKKSPKMPFPTFEDSSRNTIEMEWADIKDEDFINQDIVLLGFNFESHAQVSEQNEGGESTSQPRHGPVQRKHTGTATQPGATLATPRDYKNKTVKMDKKSIMTLETEGPTSVPTVVEGRYYEKLQNKICDLSYFQRSILWRPDFRRKTKGGQPERMSERGADSDGLPSIGGASGCPLAVKTHRGNKTVYKIFGFQNSENVGIPDDPGTKPDRWVADALLGNFRTYQSICLPEELTQQWEIVWERPKSPSVEPEDLDIEMGDQRDKERDETRGKVAKRQQQTINKVSKMPVESPRQRRLHQKKVNRVIRQIVENGLTAEEFALQPQKSPTQERLEPPVGI